MDTATIFTTIALLILLAVTSLRPGVDSRDRFSGNPQDRGLSGVN